MGTAATREPRRYNPELAIVPYIPPAFRPSPDAYESDGVRVFPWVMQGMPRENEDTEETREQVFF